MQDALLLSGVLRFVCLTPSSPDPATHSATPRSADKTVRIWDTRVAERSMLSVPGADCDVNVLSWSKLVSYLLAR